MPRQVVRDFGTCLKFDGVDDVVAITTVAAQNSLTSVSVSAWIKPNSIGENGGRIFGKSSGLSSRWRFSLITVNGKFYPAITAEYDGGDGQWRGSTPVVLGQWQHVTFTYNMSSTSNDAIMYLNGISDSTVEVTSPSGNLLADDANAYIGNDSTTERTFDGFIDDVQFYNKILSSTEIQDIYYKGQTTTGLVGHWKLDEGSGTTATDATGNANGTITGATYSTDVFMKPRTTAGNRQVVSGLYFDGSQNYVSLGTMGNFGSNIGSNFYLKFTLQTGQKTISALFGYISASPVTSFAFNINSIDGTSTTTNRVRFFLRDQNNANLTAYTSSSYNFTDGAPHTFVLTRPTINTWALTIDGVSQSLTYTNQDSPSTFSNFGDNFLMGARNSAGTAGRFFYGDMRDVEIGTTSSNLYGKYLMFEGTGTALADTSGQGNNGTLTGTPVPSWITRTAA